MNRLSVAMWSAVLAAGFGAASLHAEPASQPGANPTPTGKTDGADDAPPLIPMFPSPEGADSSEAAGSVTPLAHVEVMGSGPVPVILIPGMACDWTVFKSFMERNAQRYTMYAVTLPGFGSGQLKLPKLPPGDDYCSRRWLKNAVRALVQMMDERKIERPLVIGHSLGGHLAIWLGLEFPERVRSVIAIESGPIVPLTGGDPRGDVLTRRHQIKEFIEPRFMKTTEEAWRKEQLKGANELATDQDRATELGRMIITPPRFICLRYNQEYLVSDLTGAMEKNTIPMLMIAAVHPEANRGAVIMIRREIEGALGAPPNTSLLYFENCRHFVMDDDPRRLDSTVELFLQGLRIPGVRTTTELMQAPPLGGEAPDAPPPPPSAGGSQPKQ